MRRILILGPAGAGKSELARALGERTGLPVVHLDRLFWRSDWSPLPRDEAEANLAAAAAREEWILDGNFLAIDAGRFARADTIVLLDLPRRTCVRRILWRTIRKRPRADLPEGARDGFDLGLLLWVVRYRGKDRKRALARVEELGARVVFNHLRSAREVGRFLDGVVRRSEP